MTELEKTRNFIKEAINTMRKTDWVFLMNSNYRYDANGYLSYYPIIISGLNMWDIIESIKTHPDTYSLFGITIELSEYKGTYSGYPINEYYIHIYPYMLRIRTCNYECRILSYQI